MASIHEVSSSWRRSDPGKGKPLAWVDADLAGRRPADRIGERGFDFGRGEEGRRRMAKNRKEYAPNLPLDAAPRASFSG